MDKTFGGALNGVVGFLIPNILIALKVLHLFEALVTLGAAVDVEEKGAVIAEALAHLLKVVQQGLALFEDAVGEVKRDGYVALLHDGIEHIFVEQLDARCCAADGAKIVGSAPGERRLIEIDAHSGGLFGVGRPGGAKLRSTTEVFPQRTRLSPTLALKGLLDELHVRLGVLHGHLVENVLVRGGCRVNRLSFFVFFHFVSLCKSCAHGRELFQEGEEDQG